MESKRQANPESAGVTVNLTCDTVSDSDVTDANGDYRFTGIPANSTCDVTVDPATTPEGFEPGDNCIDTYNIELLAGESFLDADFCFTNSDTEPPVITLNGDDPQELLLDEPYTELGATVTDDSGEIINPAIDSSLIDITTPGNYMVSYDAEDSSGNTATTVFRTVTVLTQEESIQKIIDELNSQVDTGNIGNQTTALMNKLNQILAKFDAGNVNSACNQLDAFVNQINSLVNGGTLTQAEAQPILDTASQITLNYC